MTKQELLAMPKDQYMSEAQLGFFKSLLLTNADEATASIASARQNLAELEVPSDPVDKASVEEERTELMRKIARANKALVDISASLKSIREGEYGYCLETGEQIGLGRLLIQPTATQSVTSQAVDEANKRHYATA